MKLKTMICRKQYGNLFKQYLNNSEKQYKKCYDLKFKKKKTAARRAPKFDLAVLTKRFQNVRDIQQRPKRFKRPKGPILYIYRYFTNNIFLIINTFIH